MDGKGTPIEYTSRTEFEKYMADANLTRPGKIEYSHFGSHVSSVYNRTEDCHVYKIHLYDEDIVVAFTKDGKLFDINANHLHSELLGE